MNSRDTLLVKNSDLIISGVKANDIVKNYGSPVYVMDQNHIENVIDSFFSALKENYDYSNISYASKAFCCKEIYRVISDKNIMTDASITGDVDAVLKLLNEKLEQQDHAEWKETIQEYKEKYPLTYHKDVLTGPFVIEEIYRQTNGDAVITTEVGQHQMWSAQFFK